MIYGVCSLSPLLFIDLKLESSRINSIAFTFNDPTRYKYDSKRMFLNTSNHSSPHAAELPTIWQAENKEFSLRDRERERERFVGLKMGCEGAEIKGLRKLRLLCLHGFRTSGEIIKKQVTGKWPESVLEKLDLVFVDAPFPCQGKSEVEGIFDPPYYEWFQFNKEFKEYQNFDECLAYIEECMIKLGPFDGLLGFSQGAILSAALAGMQANGAALTRVPKLKLVVIIGGAKFRNPSVVEKAYDSPIQCPSVHFLGDQDFLKEYGTELLDSYVDPLVIRHPKGHTIPRFDEKGLESMLGFLERLQKDFQDEKQEISFENDEIEL